MSKIVSYSIFESPDSVYAKEKGRSILQFTQFLPLLVRAHQVLWNGWEMWLHHDDGFTQDPYYPALVKMQHCGLVKLIRCGPSEHMCVSMLWRLKPAFEVPADCVVCRDIDGIPSPLDRLAVEEWWQSGRGIHVVHHAGAHAGIMGGTFGVRPSQFKSLLYHATWDEFLERGRRAKITFDKHGDDQHLLNQHWPSLVSDMLLHELHHDTGDLPAKDIRRVVSGGDAHVFRWPAAVDFGLPQDTIDKADSLSPGIGICSDPAPALAFYDGLNSDQLRQIRDCEK